MSRLVLPGREIHYQLEGSGPLITFAHALGSDLHLWDAQVAELAGQFTLLRYDLRGHGQSSAPAAPWQWRDLCDDVLALWDALDIRRSHFVGLSIGGMIAQHLALQAPERLDRLVLCATTSGYGDNGAAVARLWEQRIAQVTAAGMESVVEATLARWFTENFLYESADALAPVAAALRQTSLAGYAACGRLVASMDTRERLSALALPTLVVAGEDDGGTTPAMAEALAGCIAGARLEVLPQAAHLLNIEQAQLFNALLLAFFGALA